MRRSPRPPPPPPPPRSSSPGAKPAPKCHPPIAEAKTADELRDIARSVLDARKRAAARQLQAQRRDKKMRDCHTEWCEKVLPNWKKYGGGSGGRSNSKVVRKLCMAGIPTSLRGRVWPLLMGNALQVTPELMEIFHGHAQAFKHEESRRIAEREKQRQTKIQRSKSEAATTSPSLVEKTVDKECDAATPSTSSQGATPSSAGDKASGSDFVGDGNPLSDIMNPQYLGKSRSLQCLDGRLHPENT